MGADFENKSIASTMDSATPSRWSMAEPEGESTWNNAVRKVSPARTWSWDVSPMFERTTGEKVLSINTVEVSACVPSDLEEETPRKCSQRADNVMNALER